MPRATRRCLALALVVGAVLTSTTTGTSSAAPRPAAERAASACARPAGPADITVHVALGGPAVPVLVHVPGGEGRSLLPVVLNLHGSGANGPAQMAISGLREVADAERFVVVAPTAAIQLAAPTPSAPLGGWAWNVPGVPTTAGAFPPAGARDDVAFLSRVLDVVAERFCTDPRRTYATGFSGGGRMSSTLACEIPDRIAAVAPVAGLRSGRPDPDDVSVPELEDCRPDRAVPVVTFHGQQDQVNPYPGNGDLRWGYAVPVGLQAWARLNDCRVGPVAARVSPNVTRLRYTRCDARANVELYRVSNGGHTWPGTEEPLPGLGTVTQEVDAAEVMWRFFSRHRLPA